MAMDPQHPFHPDEKEARLKLGAHRQVVYRILRSGERRPLLVMLHGMGSNMTRWSEFVAHTRLKQSHDLLRLDLRGHGLSVCRCEVTMERWALDLKQILDEKGYERAIIAGHSMGALLALHFARLYPAQTASLVLVEPSFPEAMSRARRWLRPVFRSVAGLIRVVNAVGLHRRHYRYRSLWQWDEEARAMIRAGQRDKVIARYASPWVDLPYSPLSVYFQDAAEILRPAPVSSDISQPVLTLLSAGGEPAHQQITRDLLGQMPQCQIREIDASHWLMTEAPDAVREAIEDFCQS
ncbi:MAG: alpha/beta hydrolase [Gammaproteobacteria bacterium]|nr:MAG: alpha/beta hydrolase [Gammaproteobacteria bacterium]